MAPKSSKKDVSDAVRDTAHIEPQKRYTAQWRAFVNVQLSTHDKEGFVTWANENNFFDVMDAHTALGRKFSVNLDPKGNCYTAFVLERDVLSPNAGLMLSARANSSSMALWRLLYILETVLADGKWESWVAVRGDLW